MQLAALFIALAMSACPIRAQTGAIQVAFRYSGNGNQCVGKPDYGNALFMASGQCTPRSCVEQSNATTSIICTSGSINATLDNLLYSVRSITDEPYWLIRSHRNKYCAADARPSSLNEVFAVFPNGKCYGLH